MFNPCLGSFNALRILNHPKLSQSMLRIPVIKMSKILNENKVVDRHVMMTRWAHLQHELNPSLVFTSRLVVMTREDFYKLTRFQEQWSRFRDHFNDASPEEIDALRRIHAEQLADHGHEGALSFLGRC